MLENISERIFSLCQKDLLPQTRVHPLLHFCQADRKVYVKREDESGFGISGSKKRKYASLIPWLKQENIELVGIIGGARSNHVVGILQLLRENRIAVRLFLKESHDSKLLGNRMLLDLLAKPEEIRWIPKEDWAKVEPIASKLLNELSPKSYLIPEGGSCAPALPGACSLMLDILRNEREIGATFDHIFIDSGTAMMAGGVSLMRHWIGHASQLHVVLVAGSESYFSAQMNQFHQWAQAWGIPDLSKPSLPHLYVPATARSFGSTNATVWREIETLAKEEGILLDPIYTAKLFLTARQVIQQQALKGKILLLHSGGGTGLMGFQRVLSS